MAALPTRSLPAASAPVVASALVLLLVACSAPGIQQQVEAPPLNARTRALYARTNLEKARALYAQGRIEHAAMTARRGLGFQPDNAELLRLRAELLEQLGDDEEAAALRARADEIAPPLAPPQDGPHPLSSSRTRVLVALLPPSPSLLESASRARVPTQWPRGVEAETLAARLSLRLPHAEIVTIPGNPHATSSSVPASQAWLAAQRPDAVVSVRVERAFCGSSVKDGDFAVAWLRVATALPEEAAPEARLIRTALDTPPDHGCEAAAIAYAVERMLELSSVHAVLQAGAVETRAPWPAPGIRMLFPTLDWRVQEEIAQGRRYLSVGELALSLQHFRNAQRIDPEDPATLSFIEEASRTLALARLLEQRPASSAEDGTSAPALDAQLSESQRRGMEAQLAHERRRRDEMLSALAVLHETRSAPTPGTFASMHPARLDDPTATGIGLAISRLPSDRALEVRSLFAPDGSVLARYFFAEGGTAPVLREEDSNGDGEPDRWVGYDAKGVVSEVWEAQQPGGPPSLHIVYGPGGTPIERVELDHDGDGRLDRLFVYAAGLLREESWDTDGDGAFDRFQRFDESGSLTMREEDVDGDEEIDVRTAYNKGRIVRREILNAELLSEIQ